MKARRDVKSLLKVTHHRRDQISNPGKLTPEPSNLNHTLLPPQRNIDDAWFQSILLTDLAGELLWLFKVLHGSQTSQNAELVCFINSSDLLI